MSEFGNIPTIDEVKIFIAIDIDDDDGEIYDLIFSSQKMIENDCSLSFSSMSECPELWGDDPTIIPPDLRRAMLMVMRTLYDEPKTYIATTLKQNPLYNQLIAPYIHHTI